MSNPTSAEYEKYYVPEKSKMAVMATIGLILSIYGAASIMNDMTFGDPNETTSSWSVAGTLPMPCISASEAGLVSPSTKRSYTGGPRMWASPS